MAAVAICAKTQSHTCVTPGYRGTPCCNDTDPRITNLHHLPLAIPVVPGICKKPHIT